MTSTPRQNLSIPVFPTRPSSAIRGFGPYYENSPDHQRDGAPREKTAEERSVGGRTKRVIAMVTLGVLLVATIVAVAVGLSLAFTHKDQYTQPTNTTTMRPSITTTTNTASNTSSPPNSTMAQLSGNFTIPNLTLQDVTEASVCMKITYVITNGGQNVSNCEITDLRSGSVKAQFKVDVEKEATENEMRTLNRASTSLALALTYDSIYYVDPNSITFDDPNDRGGGALESNCGQSQQCPGQNVVCVSVVGGYVCVCAVGYQRNTNDGEPCTSRGSTESDSKQTIYVQTTNSHSQSSMRPIFQTSTTDPQTTRHVYPFTSVSSRQTSNHDSITTGPRLKTSRPDSIGSKPSPQTTRITLTQSSKSSLQTHSYVSGLNITLSSTVAAMTSSQPTRMTTTGCSVFCAPTQMCIPTNKLCDKYQDCPDDSDEINCVCDRNHYACKNGRCIYKTWLCDGVQDCPQADDESPPQCRSCNSSEFTCANPRSCVLLSAQCDGEMDCSDSSDEGSCLNTNETSMDGNVTLTSLVNVIYQGKTGFHICSDNWTETWSDSVCKQMGQQKSASTTYQSTGLNDSFLVLDLSVSASNLLAYLQISNCSSKMAVAVSCMQSVCGTRSVSPDMVGPYILNGIRAQRGAWPWQVLFYVGTYSVDGSFTRLASCGGSLINDRWILTAGHCNTVNFGGLGYTGQLRPANARILLGSLTRDGDADAVYAGVDAVFVHPSFNTTPTVDNDVGLLRLSGAVTFTDTIRPICLPSSTEDLSQFRVCVDTGFGRTIRNDVSNDLLQVRMNLLSYTDCYNYLKNSFVRNQTQICVGTIPTEADINFCQGDSGGPLSCQGRSDGVWKVIGINSYVLGTNDGTAASTCYLSVVARVTQFVDWIQQTISANSV